MHLEFWPGEAVINPDLFQLLEVSACLVWARQRSRIPQPRETYEKPTTFAICTVRLTLASRVIAHGLAMRVAFYVGTPPRGWLLAEMRKTITREVYQLHPNSCRLPSELYEMSCTDPGNGRGGVLKVQKTHSRCCCRWQDIPIPTSKFRESTTSRRMKSSTLHRKSSGREALAELL